jgi:hypothetical protein
MMRTGGHGRGQAVQAVGGRREARGAAEASRKSALRQVPEKAFSNHRERPPLVSSVRPQRAASRNRATRRRGAGHHRAVPNRDVWPQATALHGQNVSGWNNC